MSPFKANLQIHRGGKQYRCHKQRYFYIKQIGWFVRIRGDMEISQGIELFDGVLGPFTTRAKAKFQLLKLIYKDQPELFESRPFEH